MELFLFVVPLGSKADDIVRGPAGAAPGCAPTSSRAPATRAQVDPRPTVVPATGGHS